MSEAKHYFVYTTKEKLEEIGATDIYESKQPNGMTIFNAELTHDQAIKLIPEGPYCYHKNAHCPFWDKFPNLPDQSSGFCHFMKKGDFTEDSTLLLWDQVKECGINDIDDDENEF